MVIYTKWAQKSGNERWHSTPTHLIRVLHDVCVCVFANNNYLIENYVSRAERKSPCIDFYIQSNDQIVRFKSFFFFLVTFSHYFKQIDSWKKNGWNECKSHF